MLSGRLTSEGLEVPLFSVPFSVQCMTSACSNSGATDDGGRYLTLSMLIIIDRKLLCILEAL